MSAPGAALPATPAATATKTGKSRARLWFALHGWLALPLWIFLLFVCVTGTLATVDKEILWLIDTDVRAGADGPRLPLNDIITRVEAQVPGAKVAMISLGEPYMALAVTIHTPGGAQAVAWVDPVSGQVTKVGGGVTFAHIIRSLHGWLLMPWAAGTPIGWYLVCAMGLPLLGSAITGLVVYKRFWRAWTSPRLRLHGGGRLFWGDLHRLVAVWGLWFIIIIAITGLWFLVRGIQYDIGMNLDVEGPDIAAAQAPRHDGAGPPPAFAIDRAIAATAAARPGFRPTLVILPEHALGPITLWGRPANPLLQEQIWAHPYDGHVLGGRDAGNAGADEVITAIAGSLHFGNFAGLPVKLVWTVFGLAMTTLVASGTVIWTRRAVGATPAGGWRATWWGRRRFHLGGLVLLLPLAAAPNYFVRVAAPPLGATILAPRQVGPFQVTLAAQLPGAPRPGIDGAARKDYTLAIKDGYPDRIRTAYLRVGPPHGPNDLGEVLHGDPYRLHVHLPLPADWQAGELIWLTLEEWDGRRHQATWPLAETFGPG